MGDIGERNDRARPHAVILAGGKGVRLRPYTTALPKPLVPLGDECPILEVVLRQLARAGFRSASVAIGHLGPLIRAFVGDGRQWGIEVEYWEEANPLGTVGPLVAHRVSEQVYQAAAQAQATDDGAQATADGEVPEEEVVDAEVVDEEKS